MRVTIGDHDNKFVRHLSLGDAPVKELWLGDRKLYPSDEERVQRLFVELPEIYSDEWCILQHGLDALKMRSKDSGYMVLRVAGYSYAVGFAHSGLGVVGFEGEAFVFGTDEGPSLQDIDEGDVCELGIYLPSRKSKIIQALPDVTDDILPALPQSKLMSRLVKGRKKTNARMQVWLLDSNDSILKWGAQDVLGHKRGIWIEHEATVTEYASQVKLRVWVNDTQANWAQGWLAYPAITRSISLPIRLIINQ